jgi:hypothetical protein
MDSVYLTAAGTIALPRGPLDKSGAMKVAAAIIRILDDTNFDGVQKEIDTLRQEEQRRHDYYENIALLNARGYQFHAGVHGDSWSLHDGMATVVVLREELFNSKGSFAALLNRKELPFAKSL